MVNVYLANIQYLSDPKNNLSLMTGLPESRKHKILRYKRIMDRKKSLGAGLLLQQVLAQYGKSITDVTYGAHGKPEIDGIYFNVSHSGDYVLCVVSEKPVGCDIERVTEGKERVAKRYYSECEKASLHRATADARTRMFFRLWTMKESYLKMTGEGLGAGIEQVEIVLDTPVKVYRNGIQCSCNIKEYELPEYQISVCAEENEFAQTIVDIDL